MARVAFIGNACARGSVAARVQAVAIQAVMPEGKRLSAQ